MIGAGIALLAAAVLAAGLHALRGTLPRRPSAFDAAMAERPDTASRPASFEAVERLVSGATAHAGLAPGALARVLDVLEELQR